jgi:hypothetical protein
MKYFGLCRYLIFALFISCDGEDSGLSEREKRTILLSKKWDVANVLLNNVDITNLGYTLSKIEFKTDGTWVATQGGDLFENSGTWFFDNEELTKLSMSGKEVSFTLNEQGSNLELSFALTSTNPIGGRGMTIEGDYRIFLLPSYPN